MENETEFVAVEVYRANMADLLAGLTSLLDTVSQLRNEMDALRLVLRERRIISVEQWDRCVELQRSRATPKEDALIRDILKNFRGLVQ